MQLIKLPFPPSVNGLYKNIGLKRAKTKTYRAWLQEAGMEMAIQKIKPVTTPVSVSVVAHLPDKRRRDPDNLFKAIMDLLVSHGTIEDDDFKHVVGISITAGDKNSHPGSVDVYVEHAKPADLGPNMMWVLS